MTIDLVGRLLAVPGVGNRVFGAISLVAKPGCTRYPSVLANLKNNQHLSICSKDWANHVVFNYLGPFIYVQVRSSSP